MSFWDELVQCGLAGGASSAGGAEAGTWVGAGAGALGGPAGAIAGAAVGGTAGAAVGGIYGCLAASDLDEVAWRNVKRGVGKAWDALTDLFDDAPQRPVDPPLGKVLQRVAWTVERRRRFTYERCSPPQMGALLAGTCTSFTPVSAAELFTPNNRRLLYGAAGVAMDPDVLYRGLAAQYLKLRVLDTQSAPEALVLQAVKSVGDWLSQSPPDGAIPGVPIEDWAPTTGLHRVAGTGLTPGGAAVTVAPIPEPSSFNTGLLVGLGTLFAVGAGAGLFLALR